jgi:hypothetical protein
MRALLAALVLLGPALASAGERTLVLKTFEDPSTPPDPQVCANAGFPVNVPLGASVWSLQTKARSGEIVNETIRQVGTVTGCALMTSVQPYAPGQRFLMRFALEDGVYVATGTCDLASFGVPVPGLMLVGCALRVVEGPGIVGGIATSASVFVPPGVGEIPGFGTGSIWTLHLYTQD